MNFEPMRRLQSKLSVAFLAAAALVLASCGGGGATSSPTNVGTLQQLPSTSSLYAGVPYTFTIVGGRKPYLVTSSEQTLVELNITLDGNTFSIVPRNPGVVDVGLDPNEVPRRTVNIEVRDNNGASLSNAYNVLQNFFTGYRETYSSTCASAGAGAVAPQGCSGTDSIVTRKGKIGDSFMNADSAVIFFGSEGLGLQGSKTLASACARALHDTGHFGKPNSGLIGVWEYANHQGAAEIGFEPVDNLQAAFDNASAVYIAGADPIGDGAVKLRTGAQTVPAGTGHLRDRYGAGADVVLPAQTYMERDGTFTSA